MPDSAEGSGIAPRAAQGIRLIAGLGNPGKEYEGTRHNIGFAVLDELASQLGASFSKELKWDAWLAKISTTESRSDLSLLKPTTFMNLSGESVGEFARFHRIPASSALIVIDDISLPLGMLRLRREGGSGGQNGLKSVLIHFATEKVPRLRVGVGAASLGRDLSSHVLSKFQTDELSLAKEAISRAVSAIQCILSEDMDRAMNLYNSSPTSATTLQTQ